MSQGSILGPRLYVLYTSDLPTSRETTLSTFADDTAIFATHEDPMIASLYLQEHLHIVEIWLKKWKTKVNESKSSHITFTLRKGHLPCTKHQPNCHTLNRSSEIPRTTLRLQVKLERKHCQKKETNRLKNKRDQLVDRKKKSHLSTENKLLNYKAVNQTYLELRNRTVGFRQQVQHSHHAEIPIQNSRSHSKCTLVCNKSYSTYRLQHPLRKRRHP